MHEAALKKIIIIILSSICFCTSYQPKSGDIIFQTSKSAQSKAIQIATKSKYSHMGIIFITNNKFYVYEASNFVKLTPLKKWIKKGINNRYLVKRLINADQVLTENAAAKLYEEGKKYSGKPYDPYFEWNDDKIYCSELVWKIYKNALGIEIGHLKKLKDFDLTKPMVMKKLKERFNDQIPYEETVISPEEMFISDKIIEIYKN